MLEPSREVFWNIPPSLQTIFYIFSAVAIAIFLIGSWLRLSVWLKGKDDPTDMVSKKSALGLIWMSMTYMFSTDCLFAKKVFGKSFIRAVMLIFVYWGFIILFIGTVIVAIDYDLNLHFLRGDIYIYFSLILDIAGALLLIGLIFFILRRYLIYKDRVVSGWEDASVLILMLIIALTGFAVEGIRLAVSNPNLMDLSPIGAIFSSIIKSLTPDIDSLKLLYRVFWIIHALSALSFIVYIPFSKQFHMFAAQITTYEASTRESRLKEIVRD